MTNHPTTILLNSSNGSSMSHAITKIIQRTTKLSKFLTNKIPYLYNNTAINMLQSHQISKRPTCQTCSKPLSLCLCTRLKTPNLDNNVHVTILQHSLEKKHPLNSAKIAKLGLKNVHVYTVTDVMFDAQFDIHPLGWEDNVGTFVGDECTLSVCGNANESVEFDGSLLGGKGYRKRGFDQVSEVVSGVGLTEAVDSDQFSGCLQENVDQIVDNEGCGGALAEEDDRLSERCDAENISTCDGFRSKDVAKLNDKALLSVTVGKYGEISNVSHLWKLPDEGKSPNLEHLIASPEALKSVAGGFVVTKLQKMQKSWCTELEQFEEFRITVPPGSALLFPAQKAVPAEAVEYEVKNLIVLDGTWAKANRMYNENPWLKFLPSVRLDVEKLSMFSEVRRQPKPGYLSTIESIVYALDALGGSEKLEGLDNLLEVFESMVEDQRRYKVEALKKQSSL